MDVNPWNSTIVKNACRVCLKQFCCKNHRTMHEMEEHEQLAPRVKTLPEICQKCSTFVSNICDLNSECARLTNKRYNVLNEHSPNIIVDRPRKRTYSMMNIVKDPTLNSEQDCLSKRPKTQAKKRNSRSRKIFDETELKVAKKDSEETSPKFEEIKSSSTPIKHVQQDLRVKLLKSKLEPSTTRTSNTSVNFKLLSPHWQKGNSSCKKTPLQFEKSCENTREDEIERSVYGTPGSENLTPFIRGKKCNVLSRNGDSTNASIYETPKSSLISIDTSTVSKGWADGQELRISNSRPNKRTLTESEKENLKNTSKFSGETESSEKITIFSSSNKNMNKEAEKMCISLLQLDSKLSGAPSILSSFNSKMADTDESGINNKEITSDGKLHVSSKSFQENLYDRKDGQILSEPRVNNSEKEIVNQQVGAFVKPSIKMDDTNNQSCHQRGVEDSVHLVPLSPKENSTGYLNKTPDRGSELPFRQELPTDASQQRHGGDDKQMLSEESTPDSITKEIVRNQLLNNNSFYFKPISSAKLENMDEFPKFKNEELNPFSSFSTEVINLSCSHELIPTTTSCENTIELDSLDLELSLESKARVEMKKQLGQFKLPGKSIQAETDYSQVDQMESPQENQTIEIYSSVDHLDDGFYTPFKEGFENKSFAPQSSIYSNSKRNINNSSSYSSIDDWKSFIVVDKGSQEPLLQNPNDTDNQGLLINIENISDTPRQSHMVAYKEKNHSLYRRDPDTFEASLLKSVSEFPKIISDEVEKIGGVCHSLGRTPISGGDVSCKNSVSYVATSTKEKDSLRQVSETPSKANLLKGDKCYTKNLSLDKSNLSSHCSRSSGMSNYDLHREVVLTEATCSDDLPVTGAQKQNLYTYEEGPSSCFEDSFFKKVTSTPMIRPRELTGGSLNEDLLDSTKNCQNKSSLCSGSKRGFFNLAKNTVKSYFPNFFNSKTRKSRSTEDLHSPSFQAQNLQNADITLDISQIQKIDKTTSEGENIEISLKILKRRPIWSWPKRRRPIHENRARVTEDTFSNMEMMP